MFYLYYQKGLLYFLANDQRVQEDVRGEMSKWGLSKDEFNDPSNRKQQSLTMFLMRMPKIILVSLENQGLRATNLFQA